MVRAIRSARSWKLAPIVAAAVALTLLLGGGLLAYSNEKAYAAQKMKEAGAQARILASTVTAALAFNDRTAAREYVDAMSANPEVLVAALYRPEGALFAAYARSERQPAPARAPPEGARFTEHGLIVVEKVTQGGTALGSVYLEVLTEPLSQRLERYGLIGLLVTMASLVVVVLGAAQAALARAHARLESHASALARANRNLQAEMRQREKAEDALRQAQKMEALGQLTSGVAHDFNNLLTGVLGNIELAASRNREPGIERLLQAASRSAGRGAKLTQQLLAFGRRQHLRARTVELDALIRGMKDMLARTIGPMVAIELELSPDAWPAFVDPAQIETAIVNLAINSRDAMPRGGVLTIGTENVAADGAGRPPDLGEGGDFVMISVTDTGTGMDAATVARAFEPFYTTKEVGKGTGLGLSQVYGLAKQSGGAARIDSEPGRGTTVRLYLPRSASPVGETAAAAGGQRAPGEARVLLVDDDAEVRDVAAEMLRSAGCAVVEAEDGAKALEALRRGEAIDVLVADYAMPGMTGVELVRAARQLRPGLPALIITGFAEAASLAAVSEIGRVLRKPFRRADLLAAVDEAASRSDSPMAS
jgi:signal transduction histidine kinase/ActR/RegA family two-component response regulator